MHVPKHQGGEKRRIKQHKSIWEFGRRGTVKLNTRRVLRNFSEDGTEDCLRENREVWTKKKVERQSQSTFLPKFKS